MHLFPMPTIFSFQKLKIDLEYFPGTIFTPPELHGPASAEPPNNKNDLDM